MKQKLTFIFLFMALVALSQKKITYWEDTLQYVTWNEPVDFKTARDRGIMEEREVWKTNCKVTVDLSAMKLTYFYIPESRIHSQYKIVKFKKTATSFYFEFTVEGYTTPQKVLISKTEAGGWCLITEWARKPGSTFGGEWDRDIEVEVE